MNERRKVLKPFEDHHEYIEERVKSGIETNRKGYGWLRFLGTDQKPRQLKGGAM